MLQIIFNSDQKTNFLLSEARKAALRSDPYSNPPPLVLFPHLFWPFLTLAIITPTPLTNRILSIHQLRSFRKGKFENLAFFFYFHVFPLVHPFFNFLLCSVLTAEEKKKVNNTYRASEKEPLFCCYLFLKSSSFLSVIVTVIIYRILPEKYPLRGGSKKKGGGLKRKLGIGALCRHVVRKSTRWVCLAYSMVRKFKATGSI